MPRPTVQFVAKVRAPRRANRRRSPLRFRHGVKPPFLVGRDGGWGLLACIRHGDILYTYGTRETLFNQVPS